MLLGSHFFALPRFTYGRLSFSVELVYRRNAPGGFTVNAARERVQQLLARGVKVALRADDGLGQSLPVMGDEVGCHEYVQWCQDLAADPVFRMCDWLICGNEPNLPDENRESGGPAYAWWPARVVTGHTMPSEDTSNVSQFVRTVNPTMQVLLPAVAPYSDAIGGGQPMPQPMLDGRTGWALWESYHYDLWECAYDNNYHVELGDVKGALHGYGAHDLANNGGATEPFVDVREPTHGAQFGSRWIGDALWYARQAQRAVYGSTWNPWVLISEANMYRPPQTPASSYIAGWWKNFVLYAGTQPNVMGVAAFVDQPYGGWEDTSMIAARGKESLWNTDHDAMLRDGW